MSPKVYGEVECNHTREQATLLRDKLECKIATFAEVVRPSASVRRMVRKGIPPSFISVLRQRDRDAEIFLKRRARDARSFFSEVK